MYTGSMFTFLVSGSSIWDAPATVHEWLKRAHDKYGTDLVVVTACRRGAEAVASSAARKLRIQLDEIRPGKVKNGEKPLGLNELLVARRPDYALIFSELPLEPMTTDLMARLRAARIRFRVVEGREA